MTPPIHHDGEGPPPCCGLILLGLLKGQFSQAPGEPTKAKLGPRTFRGEGRGEQMNAVMYAQGIEMRDTGQIHDQS